MEEAGNQEAIWTVLVVAPTGTHMMVTVRHNSMSEMTMCNRCGTKKKCANIQPNLPCPITSYCRFFLHPQRKPHGNLFFSFPDLQSKLYIFILLAIFYHWHLHRKTKVSTYQSLHYPCIHQENMSLAISCVCDAPQSFCNHKEPQKSLETSVARYVLSSKVLPQGVIFKNHQDN